MALPIAREAGRQKCSYKVSFKTMGVTKFRVGVVVRKYVLKETPQFLH
jgi:hypothetical protein